MAFNIVEFLQEPDSDCAFDQPCKFGHRVEGHAVYCHNDEWHDSPRKCRRTWYSGGRHKDEDCPGFQPNDNFAGEFAFSSVVGEQCSQCGGVKLITPEDGQSETCPRCMGDGVEPKAINLTQYEQNTLETAYHIADRPGERYVRIAEIQEEKDSIYKMDEMSLIIIRSVTFTKNASVFLLESTAKGQAVMRANWAARRTT